MDLWGKITAVKGNQVVISLESAQELASLSLFTTEERLTKDIPGNTRSNIKSIRHYDLQTNGGYRQWQLITSRYQDA